MASQINVTPLIVPIVNWTDFLKDVSDLTGQSLTQNIDTLQHKLSPHARFLMALMVLNGETDLFRGLSYSNAFWKHLSFSFLISAPHHVIVTCLEFSDLKVSILVKKSKTECLAIITGTLKEWFDAIIAGCSNQRSHNHRILFTQCYELFRKIQLDHLWRDYSREYQSNETYNFTRK